MIQKVRSVTHIAPPDEHGRIIDEPVIQEGHRDPPTTSSAMCRRDERKYATTTEVYPDSPRATDEQCNQAQVAAITAGLDHIMRFELHGGGSGYSGEGGGRGGRGSSPSSTPPPPPSAPLRRQRASSPPHWAPLHHRRRRWRQDCAHSCITSQVATPHALSAQKTGSSMQLDGVPPAWSPWCGWAYLTIWSPRSLCRPKERRRSAAPAHRLGDNSARARGSRCTRRRAGSAQ